jgi:hypothetical protein
VGFVVEDMLASKIFSALVDASSTSISSNSSVGSTLLDVLREVITFRNLAPLCRALSGVILHPNAHAASARLAGEITAIQVVWLLHLLGSQRSSQIDEFAAALGNHVAKAERSFGGSDVAAGCVNRVLFIMCMQAHVMIGEGRLGAAAHVISGESFMITAA